MSNNKAMYDITKSWPGASVSEAQRAARQVVVVAAEHAFQRNQGLPGELRGFCQQAPKQLLEQVVAIGKFQEPAFRRDPRSRTAEKMFQGTVGHFDLEGGHASAENLSGISTDAAAARRVDGIASSRRRPEHRQSAMPSANGL